MLGQPTPNDADPTGEWYAFEKGAGKAEGGEGFADVWMRDHFAWEYKGKRKDLAAAYSQLNGYREALGNPPLLVVCDLARFEIHTNFTNTVPRVYRFTLDDLGADPGEPLRILRAVFTDPESLRPTRLREELTERAAQDFAALATALRARGHHPHAVAHFLDRLLFAMFAEDAGILPKDLIDRLSSATKGDAAAFSAALHDLFAKMAKGGGLFGVERIEWFDGGLFDDAEVIELTAPEIEMVGRVSRLDWSQIEPAIFGTLFERGLDPDQRAQLGAHYTDRASILRLVEPVLMAPLRRDWAETQAAITPLVLAGRKVTARTPADQNPERIFRGFLDRLRSIRVLDPACGSGNFLYISLQLLKDLEYEAIGWGSLVLQIPQEFPGVGPQNLLGIEVNPFAAELARVTIWIGQIQWMLAHGLGHPRDPWPRRAGTGQADRRHLLRLCGRAVGPRRSERTHQLRRPGRRFPAGPHAQRTARAGHQPRSLLGRGSDQGPPSAENLGVAFIGDQKSGPFDVPGEVARDWLRRPNPDGRDNRDVMRPWVNGLDLTRRPRGMWIVDFGTSMAREEAALYEAPFEHVRREVLPSREASGIGVSDWWLHWRPRPEMREAAHGLERLIVSPRVSKYRLFVWLPVETLPDSAVVAIAHSDDYTFGVLHSRIHELWARGNGTQLREVESGFRYTPTTCFETFPFPRPTDGQREVIAAAARRLVELRDGWLNPPLYSEAELAVRTLTNLYNERPTWLADAHETLDVAVFAPYGWPTDLSDDEILVRLLELNLQREPA